MPPKFGTSGLRGLVTDLTEALVKAHVSAFIASCPVGRGLYVAQDRRASSAMIAGWVEQAAQSAGLPVNACGAVPTPSLALASMTDGCGAVMVTGSHIPDDRNGLKFYTPAGEITKAHEAAILTALRDGTDPAQTAHDGVGARVIRNVTAGAAYKARYLDAFGADCLSGLRIGVYAHSAVGRDLMHDILAALGAQVVDLGRSDTFIPVDTEAVDAETRGLLQQWAATQRLDAIVSTDGDGDRPLMTDATGQVIPGDVLGQITAAAVGAEIVVTPVSSNTGVEASGQFARIIRTRIGSPFVIAAMEAAGGRVVGYEANGGFLLGFAAQGPAGPLAPLMTRDALLPLIAPLVRARGRGIGMAALVADEPPRFTASDRLQEVPSDVGQALVARLDMDASARAAFLGPFGTERSIDRTDGLRITLADGRIVHLRPSGNAPELRFYAEAESQPAADALLRRGLDALAQALRG